MYLTDARRGYDITTREGVRLKGKGARIWRCRPDGSGLEPILGGGYDNAIELVFMPGGETIGTMTYFLDPQGGQRDALMHWIEGGVYPKPHAVIDEDKLKFTGDLMPVMTKIARIAPSGLMRYRGNSWGAEYNGNLFSAEFNTGRIMRSVITTDGATFTTVDEPFITSTKEDVHPTDVFQDADGSMIVINTGGWFIAGCPLSRVAKLDVPGGIYRIRKTGAKKPDDAWGNRMNFESLSPEQISKLVKDERIFVSEKATEKLVKLGDRATNDITATLLADKDENVRAAAVFILGRIGSSNAAQAVHKAFNDTSAIVRTAAARVAGLAKDRKAISSLRTLLLQNNLAVRRQAATALEQIGDTSSVPALLKAAALRNDRSSEHALIHALITLKTPAPLFNALQDTSAAMRKAAIIALDQMDGSPLKKTDVVAFLNSDRPELVKTGVWVTSHHKDWADVVEAFIADKINTGINDDQLFTLITQFSIHPRIQQYISGQLAKDSGSFRNQAFFLDIISKSPVKTIPAGWTNSLKKLLNEGNEELVAKALSVVQARSIKTLSPQLHQIISDNNRSAELRLKALSASISADPLLTGRDFKVLMSYLKSPQPPLRQQASRILSASELTSDQLKTVAKEIPAMDTYILPLVVQSFEGNMNRGTGEAFVSALSSVTDKLDNISEEELKNVLKDYPVSVKKSAEPLMIKIKQKDAQRLEQLRAVEVSLKKGDIGNGRTLFYGKATCSSCHAINNEGSTFAPDLTNIGEIRSRHDILEAIVFPGASFAREYETSKITTSTNTHTGVIREQFPDAIVLATGPGPEIRIPRAEITAIENVDVSLMPPGLDKQLTNQELSDLIAYLVSLPDGASGTIGY
jgi:putative heme-binding domain-containing protein